jgi:hypothetical protein
MSNFASRPTAGLNEEQESEKRFIWNAINDEFTHNNPEPKYEQVGITKFPDKSWDWHPFYWNDKMTETIAMKEDVWCYRSVLLLHLQIDGDDDEYTCRSIMNREDVCYIVERLEPSRVAKWNIDNKKEYQTNGFLKLSKYYYARISQWQRCYIFGRDNVPGKDMSGMDIVVLNKIICNVTGKYIYQLNVFVVKNNI